MDYSVAGLIGGLAALVAGLVLYFAMLPALQDWLRAVAPRDTKEQREDVEFKLGVMRRIILTGGLVAFGWGGYVVGKQFFGPVLGE